MPWGVAGVEPSFRCPVGGLSGYSGSQRPRDVFPGTEMEEEGLAKGLVLHVKNLCSDEVLTEILEDSPMGPLETHACDTCQVEGIVAGHHESRT